MGQVRDSRVGDGWMDSHFFFFLRCGLARQAGDVGVDIWPSTMGWAVPCDLDILRALRTHEANLI